MPDVIDLSTLTPEQGFAIRGDRRLDRAGASVSGAGDVNGDGFGDVLVGAYDNSAVGMHSGAAYVVLGHGGDFANIDLTHLGGFGVVIQGASEFDLAGRSVASAGDVNGDGIGDIVIGAAGGDRAGVVTGEAYVIFGRESGLAGSTLDLANLGTAGFTIQGGQLGDHAHQVAAAGDFNGDGFDDVIVGAKGVDFIRGDEGEAYIVFGKASGFATVDLLASSSPNFCIIWGRSGNGVGSAVSPAGDVNGDGMADVAIRADGGIIHVVFGRAAPGSSIYLDNLGTGGFVIQPGASFVNAFLGTSSAGDVNGDGLTDLFVTATREPPAGGYHIGRVCVVFGRADGLAGATIDLSNLGEAGFMIDTGFEALRASSAGDVNGDGFDDILLGAEQGDGGGMNAGEAYIVYGGARSLADVDVLNLAPNEGFGVLGDADYDLFGSSVSSAGDVNRDGFGDVVIGARRSDAGGSDSGAAYVIYGQAPSEAVNRTGTATDNTIFGGAFDDTLHGLGGDDTLEGGAGNDLLRGGAGVDTASYAHAAAAVSARLDRAVQDTGGAGADTFNSIENLTGSAFIDVLIGSRWANTLAGLDGGDFLHGGESRDTLLGGDGGDLLDGGAHKDTLTGGAGHDRFRFDDGDLGTARALADVITDFSQAEGDVLRLNLVDADTATAGDQAFAWLGNGAFTGAAGQLHYVHQGGNTYVEGDLDGDSVADVFIRLDGLHNLVAADFVL